MGLLISSGCAARRIELPTDPGAPFPEFAQVHTQITSACAAIRSMTAELGLSGRAGEQRLRGRVVAGFERPSSMRLEAVAAGQVVFILAARDAMATLYLPRDVSVLRNERPEAVLGALTGVNLAPADLQAILTGCVFPSARAVNGRLHGNGWASIELQEGTLYLQRAGAQWQLRVARRNGWRFDYPEWQGQFPQTVRLLSNGEDASVDLTATIAQLETNLDLDAAAFTVNVPADARTLTLDELRDSGPLRGP